MLLKLNENWLCNRVAVSVCRLTAFASTYWEKRNETENGLFSISCITVFLSINQKQFSSVSEKHRQCVYKVPNVYFSNRSLIHKSLQNADYNNLYGNCTQSKALYIGGFKNQTLLSKLYSSFSNLKSQDTKCIIKKWQTTQQRHGLCDVTQPHPHIHYTFYLFIFQFG